MSRLWLATASSRALIRSANSGTVTISPSTLGTMPRSGEPKRAVRIMASCSLSARLRRYQCDTAAPDAVATVIDDAKVTTIAATSSQDTPSNRPSVSRHIPDIRYRHCRPHMS